MCGAGHEDFPGVGHGQLWQHRQVASLAHPPQLRVSDVWGIRREFCRACLEVNAGMTIDEATELFDSIDLNSSGLIEPRAAPPCKEERHLQGGYELRA